MITLDYTEELYYDIVEEYLDYFQTGWTICGAQDPAFIYLSDGFRAKYKDLAKYEFVRVIDKYLNEWSSATLLEFSNKPMTDKEYEQYEEVLDGQVS